MTKRRDPDIRAMEMCIKALTKIGTPRMLRANLEFIVGHLNRNVSSPSPMEK